MPREIFDIGSVGAQIGKQILGGRAAYEDAYTKMGQALAAQSAQQAQARLHTLQGDDIVAANEARKPANLTRIAANLAGLTDPQGDAMHTYISSGSWGKSPEALPNDFIGPPQSVPLPKPEWATPEVMNRVGQYLGAMRASGALTGKTDFSNLVQGLKGVWDQGLTDRALAGQLPTDSVRSLNALEAAKKGGLYNFNEFGTGDQATGGVSFNHPYLKKNEAEIKAKDAAALASRGSAANAFANADLHRAQIPLAQANVELARMKRDEFAGRAERPKPPNAWRWKEDGSAMERIPGGPADEKFKAAKAKDTTKLAYLESTMDRLANAARELRDHPGLPGITGAQGAFKNFPWSKAADAEGLRYTLTSKIGVGALQDMRNNNPSGAALSNVSDADMELLKNNIAAVRNAQSTKQMKENLNMIIDFAESAKKRGRAEFTMLYGDGAQQQPADAVRLLNEARNAIANKADRNAVAQRLRSLGIDPSGL